jgi:putative transposase
MSAKGNCYDNAAMESFWATLKSDLGINKPYQTKEEARRAIFDYIEVFYNRRRIHSALGDLSPLDYEQQCVA